MLFAVVVILILSLFLDDIINISKAPDEIGYLVNEYMSIIIYTVFFVFILNVISASFRGIGDSRTPLIILFITVLVNAILDPILMLGLFGFPRLGVKGASIALLIGNIITVIFGIYFN